MEDRDLQFMLRRAFVAGATWWASHGGGGVWMRDDNDAVDAEAVVRYPIVTKQKSRVAAAKKRS